MADPFEVRMRFTTQLQHLNASVTSAQKAANYALKYRDMDEDLHSCILEQLEKNNMNNRANIMYFIEHLCDLSQRESHPSFTAMIQRDITHIVDAVAPPDGSGAANVKVARKVLTSLQSKDVLSVTTISELSERLDARDTLGGKGGDGGEGDLEVANGIDAPGAPSGVGSLGGRISVGSTPTVRNGMARLDKRQVEQRIEEDRERGKRQREMYWAVSGEGDDEFDRMWEETVDVNEDDFLLMTEEREERVEIAGAS
ncbi:hypothetical protein EV356DRAFT_524446 [Viridothelium virens]|uniref:CID domain-containing protein n=1 Tax=Viridothelium virens TaxID=1048519 RepID=A0A6A6H691_VIRVR|nr:hypothetical protein EV356DRAFT_524446 [Viridothelium virens]